MSRKKVPQEQALPLNVDTAAVIGENSIRAVTGFPDAIRAEDPLDKFGIDKELVNSLVDHLVTSKDGVSSAGFEIPDPNKLAIKPSTKVFQLTNLLVQTSVPKK